MQPQKKVKRIAALLKTISHPTRIGILMAVGEGEACVCHLEAVLGKRQAYISQHLMALRQAGCLSDRKDGRFVFYRIPDPDILALVRQAATVSGAGAVQLEAANCECPLCEGMQNNPPTFEN